MLGFKGKFIGRGSGLAKRSRRGIEPIVVLAFIIGCGQLSFSVDNLFYLNPDRIYLHKTIILL